MISKILHSVIGFSWKEIDPNWKNWTVEQYKEALKSKQAIRGYKFDIDALNQCEICILLLPCGKSAHLELGYAIGAEKFGFVVSEEPTEPELMYKMCTYPYIVANIEETLELANEISEDAVMKFTYHNC